MDGQVELDIKIWPKTQQTEASWPTITYAHVSIIMMIREVQTRLKVIELVKFSAESRFEYFLSTKGQTTQPNTLPLAHARGVIIHHGLYLTCSISMLPPPPNTHTHSWIHTHTGTHNTMHRVYYISCMCKMWHHAHAFLWQDISTIKAIIHTCMHIILYYAFTCLHDLCDYTGVYCWILTNSSKRT